MCECVSYVVLMLKFEGVHLLMYLACLAIEVCACNWVFVVAQFRRAIFKVC